jgi:hypothetical protein
MTHKFPCTNPDCTVIVDVSDYALEQEWFDPSDVLCDDCLDALVPEDVRSMIAAPATDAWHLELR